MLEGVFRAPPPAVMAMAAYAGRGRRRDAKRAAFYHAASKRHLARPDDLLPGTEDEESAVPYPWTVRGHGDNLSLIDVLLVNPYQAVDFGTLSAGRHYINGLYGQPLYRGLFIDQCYDVGRIENVHFWSFWGGWDSPLYAFIRSEAIAFILGRADWSLCPIASASAIASAISLFKMRLARATIY